MYKDTLMVQIYLMRRLQHGIPDERKLYYLSMLFMCVCLFVCFLFNACFTTLRTRRWIFFFFTLHLCFLEAFHLL